MDLHLLRGGGHEVGSEGSGEGAEGEDAQEKPCPDELAHLLTNTTLHIILSQGRLLGNDDTMHTVVRVLSSLAAHADANQHTDHHQRTHSNLDVQNVLVVRLGGRRLSRRLGRGLGRRLGRRLGGIVRLLGTIFILMYLNVPIMLMALFIYILGFIITYIFNKKSIEYTKLKRKINAKILNWSNDQIYGFSTIKTLLIEKQTSLNFIFLIESISSPTLIFSSSLFSKSIILLYDILPKFRI